MESRRSSFASHHHREIAQSLSSMKVASPKGRLTIAVADRKLTTDSPLWGDVEGAIPFHHKRRFTFSLVGIKANYIRLIFEVGLPTRIATR